ncbi:hypothetical protein COM61_02545 [Bacillus toyonensis]|nr:hypothetical protein COM61_02545 [Bacillus toyonensis]
MNMKEKRVELHDSLEKAIICNQNEFELKSLTYKVLMVGINGINIEAYKSVLKGLDVESPLSIIKQFSNELKVLGLEPIIHTGDMLDTLRYAYKTSFLLLKNELEELRGVVNQIRLNAVLFLLRDFMLVGFEELWVKSTGLQDYNKKVQDTLNGLKCRVDSLLNKGMLVSA